MKWNKLGRVFAPDMISSRPEWMHGFAQAPNAVVLDDRVRVFFCCRPPADSSGQFVSRCAYVDLDRQDPLKIKDLADRPVLALGDLGDFDEYGTYPVTVLRQESRLIAMFGGWTRCQSVPFNISLGLAFSDDYGKTFHKPYRGPVLSHSPDEPFIVTSPKLRFFNGMWHLTYTAGRRWLTDDQGRPEIVYKLRIATSEDLVNWRLENRDVVADKLGEWEAQACGDVYWDGSSYHMHFCYRKAFDFRSNKANSYRIGYAKSADALTWLRDDSEVTIDVSDSGWDSEMVAYPNVYSVEGQTFMLYAGNGNGRTGFGVAVLES